MMERTLLVLSNNLSGRRLFMQHTLEFPGGCCPVSKNPRPGSTITICYRAKEQVLEVASLYTYLHRFVGEPLVRDLEGMIGAVAADCAEVLGVLVRVRACVIILPRQAVQVIARGYPVQEGA